MAQVQKGKITQVIGNSAVICPFGQGAALTPALPAQQINIPGTTTSAVYPTLSVGNDVAFVLFEDGTGAILAAISAT